MYCRVELNVCVISVVSAFNVFNLGLTFSYPIITESDDSNGVRSGY